MARPNSVADLVGDQESVQIVTFRVDDLVKLHNGDVLSAYLNFLDVAERNGATTEEDYNGIVVKMPRSSKELEKKLADAQNEWDRELKRYMAALKDPNDPNQGHFEYSSLRRALNTWAVKEGFEPIDWSAREDSEADGSVVI